jgi:hypothetical protein
VVTKELSESTTVHPTRVGDAAAGWIEGAPHQFNYDTVDGTQTREVSRLAGNVLIWESEGVTCRLESALDLASSMRMPKPLHKCAMTTQSHREPKEPIITEVPAHLPHG